MKYSTALAAIRAGKKRIASLTAKLHSEQEKLDALVLKVSECLSVELGQTVTVKPAHVPVAVIRRVKQLRDSGKSYDEIATRLDVEGLKPPVGESFTREMVGSILDGELAA